MTSSVGAYASYIHRLVQRGGPREVDYADLDHWVIDVYDGIRAGQLSTADIAEIRAAFGEALSSKTMQGFALTKPHGYAGDFENDRSHLSNPYCAMASAATSGEMARGHSYCGLSLRVLALTTRGHGDEGRGPDAVYLKPRGGGLRMPAGADVFRHAVECMCATARAVLESTGLTIDAMRYFIPHQANQRITDRVAERLGCRPGRVVSNISGYGNTGSAGAVLALASVAGQLQHGENALIAVFGGGYSSGAVILRAE